MRKRFLVRTGTKRGACALLFCRPIEGGQEHGCATAYLSAILQSFVMTCCACAAVSPLQKTLAPWKRTLRSPTSNVDTTHTAAQHGRSSTEHVNVYRHVLSRKSGGDFQTHPTLDICQRYSPQGWDSVPESVSSSDPLPLSASCSPLSAFAALSSDVT